MPLAGCGEASVEPDDGALPAATALAVAATSACDDMAAGEGWLNQPLSSASGVFSASFRAQPESGAGPIDGVIGFSRGLASAFTHLGPIVRFAPSGNIDARNGGSYAGAFPYTFGDGPYELQLLVDVPRHRYSVWVRHLDSPFKPFEVLAQDFAFRTEQSAVASLDHRASIVDSAQGALKLCGYAHEPASGCVRSGPGAWRSRPFASLAPDRAQLDFYAWVTAPAIDAVVGVARGAPARFTDLAAIVRFRPDGRFDARRGGGYAADLEIPYVAGTYYHITLELDLARGTYSASVTPPGQSTLLLARDYVFRSEQSGVASLDHLGQVVDNAAGAVHTCAVVAR